MIHYRFRSGKEFSIVHFHGTSISVAELSRLICDAKNLTDSLLISNHQTGETYSDDDCVLSNTRVVVTRQPLTRSRKFVSRTPQRAVALMPSSPLSSEKNDFGKDRANVVELGAAPGLEMSAAEEKRRLEQIMRQHAGHVQAEMSCQRSRRRNVHRNGLYRNRLYRNYPHPGYVCRRCDKPGHFIQDCPTNGDARYNAHRVKTIAGVPKAFLKRAEPDTIGGGNELLYLSDGQAVRIIPNATAWDSVRTKRAKYSVGEDGEVPDELRCSICKAMFREAAMIECCQTTFCDNCIRSYLLSNFHTCPQCNKSNVGPDTLLPNKTMRVRVQNHDVRAS